MNIKKTKATSCANQLMSIWYSTRIDSARNRTSKYIELDLNSFHKLSVCKEMLNSTQLDYNLNTT